MIINDPFNIKGWKPRVGKVHITHCYYVDLDDQEMIKLAKDMILDDMKDNLIDMHDSVEVKETPLVDRGEINNYLLEEQENRLIAAGKCPYCKKNFSSELGSERFCKECEEYFEVD